MRRLLWLFVPLFLSAEEEFAFDATTFDKQRLEHHGYLRSDNTVQWSDAGRIARSANELNLQGTWTDSPVNIHADASAFYRDDSRNDGDEELLLNELRQRFGDELETLDAGKKVLRWGKGYAYSSLAFFERVRDPLYPDLSREGFWMAHAQITRTPSASPVAAYTLDVLYLPDIGENRDHFRATDSRSGAKLYLLTGQSDIDLIIAENAFGADISTDVGGGIELHGEWGRNGGEKSYLAGLRYQSPSDLTVIAESFRTYGADRYRYLKVSQKEPFSWVYSSVYLLYLRKAGDDSYRFLAGSTYDFKNGFTLDLAYVRSDLSDGAKLIVYYYF